MFKDFLLYVKDFLTFAIYFCVTCFMVGITSIQSNTVHHQKINGIHAGMNKMLDFLYRT